MAFSPGLLLILKSWAIPQAPGTGIYNFIRTNYEDPERLLTLMRLKGYVERNDTRASSPFSLPSYSGRFATVLAWLQAAQRGAPGS